MNIFVVSNNTKVCAQALDNKRLVKMVLETAQMLSGAMDIHGQTGPYKPTHLKHPCTQWVAETAGNWAWTLSLFEELAHEYYYRYERRHKCMENWEIFTHHVNNMTDVTGRTAFVNCTIFKDIEDVQEAYRLYLAHKWGNDLTEPQWTKRQQPGWYITNRGTQL